MANGLYDAAKQGFLDANYDILTQDIKIVLIDTALYSVDLTTDDFLDDVPVGAIEATSGNLASKTTTLGVFDAADVTFTTVTSTAATVEAIVMYRDSSGASTTDDLICFVDTATGLPVTPNGGDIQVNWDSGSDRIFAL